MRYMNQICIRVLFFICLIIVTHSIDFNEENADDQRYDFNALTQKSFSRFQYSSSLKDENFNISLNPLWYYDVLEHFLNFNVSNDTAKCLLDISYTFESLKAKKMWALQLFDSYGKPDSGILQGGFKWPGAYTECIGVYAPPKKNSSAGNFHGKYCSLAFGPQTNTAQLSLSPSIGICIPESCGSEVKDDILKNFHVHEGALPFNATFVCKPKERPLSNPAIAVIVLMSFFCTLTVLGSSITVIKYFRNVAKGFQKRPSLVVNVHQNEEIDPIKYVKSDTDDDLLLPGNERQLQIYKKCEEYLGCFCIFKNGSKLLNTDASEGELLCIHGIRFLSMSWVILGHAYAFCFTESKNILEVMQLVDTFLFQIVLQGFFSVDSFFVLSGFLLTYLSMKEFSKSKGSISWPYFYIHRYLRLTPVYMIILGFSASVYFYIDNGPFWPNTISDPTCATNWWWNLLYINNFSGMNKQCMGWAWYLANDMQFFVISPLFLITLWRWPKIGFSLVALFLFASSLANFLITYHFDLMCGVVDMMHMPAGDAMAGMQRFGDYFDKLYIKPYTRIGPYLIGILTGYLLFKRRMSNATKHSWVTLCIGWIIASSITLTVVYGLYHTYPPLIARSFYNALNRICFAMGLCWVIYVCLIGQGGFVNRILSYKAFIPLSRLTYTAYLIHPLILMWYYSSLKTPLEFTHATMVILYLGLLILTYALSLPVTLIFESPVIGLEKVVRKSFQTKEHQ